MRTTFRVVAMIAAISLVSGCASHRRFEQQMGAVRLPSAPTLEPSPAAVDPSQTGAVGSPEPVQPKEPFPDPIPMQF